jgi:endonuclease/exonuclease/phosphatase (EEP) superfamily protein YafD
LFDRLTWWGLAAYLVLITVATLLVWSLGDRWWPATVLLFSPRWVFLLPLALLVPLVLVRDRALIPLLLLTSWLCVFPFMGLQLGSLTASASDEAPYDLRVVSFNAQGGRGMYQSPETLLRDWGAEVAAFQECNGRMVEDLSQIPGWHFDSRSGLCLLSRYEIIEVQEMERAALEAAHGAGVVATYELDFDGTPLYVTNLHLETPRAGFELIRTGKLWAGIDKVREKSFIRDIELRRAHSWTDGFIGSQIVVGDFNTPVESRSFREAWGRWQNAYSVAGTGFGATRLNGWIRVRIDHILAGDEFEVTRAWVEEETGSDHRPVAAELRIRQQVGPQLFDSVLFDSILADSSLIDSILSLPGLEPDSADSRELGGDHDAATRGS